MQFPAVRQQKFWIGSSADPANISGLLGVRGWMRTEIPHEAELVWAIATQLPDTVQNAQRARYVNHLEHNEDIMINTENLLVHLRAYDLAHPDATLRLDDFMQPTVRLYNVPECLAFFANVEHDNSLWVFKPIGRNGGRGIFLVNRSDSDAMLEVQENRSCCSLNTMRLRHANLPLPARRRALIQRYAHDPVLLDGGYKSAPRCYILVVGSQRVYFHRGRVRRATRTYNLVDTNAYVVASTKSTDSGTSFEDFLEAVAVQQLDAPVLTMQSHSFILTRMQQIATRVINATRDRWSDSRNGTFFWVLSTML